jgi:hypothetical protein
VFDSRSSPVAIKVRKDSAKGGEIIVSVQGRTTVSGEAAAAVVQPYLIACGAFTLAHKKVHLEKA